MSTAIPQTPENGPIHLLIPPLRNGDHLTPEEFERRFDAMPGLKMAELINGVVYMAPPVGFEDHGRPHFYVMAWLTPYFTATPGVEGADNSTLRLPLANRPQPDACLLILPTHGGQVRIEKGYIVGGPELIVEVAAASAFYDLHDKLDLYRRNGVSEYVVWRVLDRAIDWFALTEGGYDPLTASPDGIFRSRIFPGLWLDAAALIGGDKTRVAEVAALGIASPEHAAFVVKLKAAVGAT
jgi:Uma2 family endonuclease